MNLLDLPEELLVLCCEQIELKPVGIRVLRALRLTCKRLESVATKRIFSNLHMAPWTESANKARAILEDKRLMPLVTSISIEASLDDDNIKNDLGISWEVPDWCRGDEGYENDAEHEIDTNGVISTTFKDMLWDIGLFTNLRRFELRFNWAVWDEERDDYGGHDVIESTEYRAALLRNVLAALNHPRHPADKVHSLSIINLHDLSNYDILQSDDFKAVLSRLDTLKLSIASEYDDAAPENSIGIPDRHRFFGKDLLEFWLAPVSQNLVNLKLYGSCYWGYIPKCDFRGLQFPRLRRLALGNMTFTHDWQLDWILSHGQTLESLTLDDCPIVHDAKVYYPLDSERNVELSDDYQLDWSYEGQHVWSYPARWHDYFDKMASGLPRLCRFAIGHGPWNNYVGEDAVTEAFEAAARLEAKLDDTRYVIFHSGTGPSQWIEPEKNSYFDPEIGQQVEAMVYDCCWDDDDEPPLPEFPGCGKRDQEALDGLLEKVKGRNLGR